MQRRKPRKQRTIQKKEKIFKTTYGAQILDQGFQTLGSLLSMTNARGQMHTVVIGQFVSLGQQVRL
jgi:hypothetical protein